MTTTDSRTRAETVRPQVATVLWHPDLHRQVAQEQLVFATLALKPRYQRDLALQVIDRAVAGVGVRSYAVWELQRKPDLLLKLWVPPTKNSDDVLLQLGLEARQHPNQSSELSSAAFTVKRTLYHHLWPRSLEPAELEDALGTGGDFLTSGHVTGPLGDQLESMVRRQIVAPIHVDVTGVKFFIWLALENILPSDRARSQLEMELVRVRERITESLKELEI